jgi:hypothetical protein
LKKRYKRQRKTSRRLRDQEAQWSNAGASGSIYLPLLIAGRAGENMFRVATFSGDTSRPDPNVARHEFEVPLV